jgi:hypothetical protein
LIPRIHVPQSPVGSQRQRDEPAGAS